MGCTNDAVLICLCARWRGGPTMKRARRRVGPTKRNAPEGAWDQQTKRARGRVGPTNETRPRARFSAHKTMAYLFGCGVMRKYGRAALKPFGYFCAITAGS